MSESMNHSILIVDDEFALAELVGELLQLRGYKVELAINGQLGLARMSQQRFSLVITDMMMPIMNGMEMVQRMRASPDLAGIPVIVMTAVPSGISPEERRLVQGLLPKPFGPAAIYELIDRVLVGN
jgi:two-component system, OmpR family, response regulator VicR